ncbi:PucR family transcriptional regulator [Mycobacterium sp. CBMA 234]|uniref:PucR family transcriptional regulator n=1 Tax=Mycolicibacterium sp. CBMA 234 TaxID=1918495 RepID=UPI0012DDE712|nr:helix-turn-helix domain-containing protein [Mycolicibacterium sp. CBMA 234]MUL67899.1 PucR family transcriptional regulator [Mycolicibacterium sp. CBMA 234]
MAAQNRDYTERVAEAAAAIIARLGDQLGAVTQATQQVLLRDVSELRGDTQLLQLLRDNTAANIDTFFAALRNNIPLESLEPPTAAMEYARRLAQREVASTALIRAYRLGHQTVLGIMLDAVRASGLEIQLQLDTFELMTELSFRYIDWVTQQAIAAYQEEHDRWQDKRNSLRALRVRELLEAGDVDVDLMSTSIGYPLRRTHLAVVLWTAESGNNDELATLERFVHRAAESLGAQENPLFISADRSTGWAWIPLAAHAGPTALGRLGEFVRTEPTAPHIAAGTPLPGAAGFRRSHEQAADAYTVALASDSPDDKFTPADQPGILLAAMLRDKPESVHKWIGEILGPLADDTDSDSRLRETLSVFLRTGSSFTAAAAELHLHFNSVRYRVGRAEQRRGRPIADDRLDVEVALLLRRLFGQAP